MKVYYFIGTLLLKNKLFTHSRQKKRKLILPSVIPDLTVALHSIQSRTEPVVEVTRKVLRALIPSILHFALRKLLLINDRFIRIRKKIDTVTCKSPVTRKRGLMSRKAYGWGIIKDGTSLIRKKIDKVTCKSPVTRKRNLMSCKAVLLRRVNAGLFLGKLRVTKDKSLASYVLYLATIKILFCVCLAHAGSRLGETTGVALSTDSIKPLKIGDTIPEALWNLPLQMIKAGQEGSTTVTLNDYKGKLIILDFWATWCGGCIAGFPKMEVLAAKFSSDLTVLPIGYDAATKIKHFMESNSNGKHLKESIYNANDLQLYFPHVYIPHYIWIRDKRVIAITAQREINESNISSLLNGHLEHLRNKEDIIGFDRSKPFFANLNSFFSKSLLWSSTLTEHVDGLSRSGSGGVSDDGLLWWKNFINTPLLDLYRFATKLPFNHFLNETTDKSLFENVENDAYWYQQNAYCFEIILPNTSSGQAKLDDFVVEELNSKLDLNGRWQSRWLEVYVIKPLIVDQKLVALKENTQRSILSATVLTNAFNNYFQVKNHKIIYNPILINELGDTLLPAPPENVYQSPDSLKSYLHGLGIDMVSERRKLKVFVLAEK